MPVDGMEKRANCPDCHKRVKLIYRNGRWHWQLHADKDKRPCRPDKP